jgi:hypothetical protein
MSGQMASLPDWYDYFGGLPHGEGRHTHPALIVLEISLGVFTWSLMYAPQAALLLIFS